MERLPRVFKAVRRFSKSMGWSIVRYWTPAFWGSAEEKLSHVSIDLLQCSVPQLNKSHIRHTAQVHCSPVNNNGRTRIARFGRVWMTCSPNTNRYRLRHTIEVLSGHEKAYRSTD